MTFLLLSAVSFLSDAEGTAQSLHHHLCGISSRVDKLRPCCLLALCTDLL